MIAGKMLIDIKFAIIKDIEYQPCGFQYKLTFMSDKPPTHCSISTVNHVKPGDIWIEHANGGWEIMSAETFNKLYIPEKKE